jgi:dimethylhistidine N-methyltransferase
MSSFNLRSGVDRAEKLDSENAASRAELIAGLSQAQARIAPKYFYDALGSKLFEAICELNEYYLTRTEAAIFADHANEIAQAAGQGMTLIDLGAGNCRKAASLFNVLKPGQYVPVDISAEFLLGAVAGLRKEYPDIPMHPVGLDFSESLNLPPAIQRRSNKLFFYPGSSLGNFSPLEAAQFLFRIREHEGAVLIGVDLAKDFEALQAAYDDALGVTAAFNRNILRHINGILESDFDVGAWAHVAFFNTSQSRIEMHLQARDDIMVSWPGGTRHFAKGERIHTENSYKFTKSTIVELLREAGFGDMKCWTDPGENYLVCHARAV